MIWSRCFLVLIFMFSDFSSAESSGSVSGEDRHVPTWREIERSCKRYEDAFRRPEVRERLEHWFSAIPKKLAAETLSQVPARGPMRGLVSSFPLELNPAEIGLNADARVEVSALDDGTLVGLAITDTYRVSYEFKTGGQGEGLFRVSRTMRLPPIGNVGVRCLLRD